MTVMVKMLLHWNVEVEQRNDRVHHVRNRKMWRLSWEHFSFMSCGLWIFSHCDSIKLKQQLDGDLLIQESSRTVYFISVSNIFNWFWLIFCFSLFNLTMTDIITVYRGRFFNFLFVSVFPNSCNDAVSICPVIIHLWLMLSQFNMCFVLFSLLMETPPSLRSGFWRKRSLFLFQDLCSNV